MLKHLLRTLLLLFAVAGFTACSSDRDFLRAANHFKTGIKIS